MLEEDEGARRWLPWAVGGVLVAVLGTGLWFAFSALTGVPPPEQPKVQQISLVVPPPPPPPPKVEEPPPEPEVEEIPEPEEPEPVADESNEPPPGEDLGLDAEGTAGGDAFGLKAKKGGRSITDLQGGGEGWYASTVGKDIERCLADSEDARGGGDFAVVVKVWLSTDGGVQRSELLGTTGDAARDEAILEQLGRCRSQAMPDGLAESLQSKPLRLRIRART